MQCSVISAFMDNSKYTFSFKTWVVLISNEKITLEEKTISGISLNRLLGNTKCNQAVSPTLLKPKSLVGKHGVFEYIFLEVYIYRFT